MCKVSGSLPPRHSFRKLLKGLFHQEEGVNQERLRFQEMESAQD